jgi:hypothetical protein
MINQNFKYIFAIEIRQTRNYCTLQATKWRPLKKGVQVKLSEVCPPFTCLQYKSTIVLLCLIHKEGLCLSIRGY